LMVEADMPKVFTKEKWKSKGGWRLLLGVGGDQCPSNVGRGMIRFQPL
jgi:hypothetical protein